MPDDEQDGEDGLSMEEQVAALVRAAQSDPENLSEWTKEEIEKAEAEKREEEVVHLVELLASVAKIHQILRREKRLTYGKLLPGKIQFKWMKPRY